MTFWKWSRVAASNGNADTTVNFQEGQAPSTLNDAGRGVMAAAAKYRDDMAGAIVTGGSVNAYTVLSYQGFDSLAHLDGQCVAFSPHVTNTGACTIIIDGLAAKPLRPSPGVDFLGGELIAGTPYTVLYNNATGEAYVRGFITSPYAVPIGAGIDFWGPTAPNSAFAFPTGQAISRATYAKLFALIGTTYGVGLGDGLTFSLPDKVGRVSAMLDAGGARLTAAGFGAASALGSVGGADTRSLAANQIPAGVPSTVSGVTIDAGGAKFVTTSATPGNASIGASSGTGIVPDVAVGQQFTFPTSLTGGSGSATSTNAAQAVLKTVQPTIVCNYVIRVL